MDKSSEGAGPEPETPEGVLWLRWIAHQLFHEGAVIRKAPTATVVLAALMFLAARWFMLAMYTGEISTLQGTIDTKDAQIQFLDQRLQDAESRNGGETNTTIARARLKYAGLARAPNAGNKYRWDVAFTNVGSAAAVGTIHVGDARVTDHVLSPKELDAWFADLHKRLIPYEGMHLTAETQPQDGIFWTQGSEIEAKKIDDVIAGKATLYNAAVVEYRDPDVPPGKFRITEYCVFTSANSAEVTCDAHNRISLSN